MKLLKVKSKVRNVVEKIGSMQRSGKTILSQNIVFTSRTFVIPLIIGSTMTPALPNISPKFKLRSCIIRSSLSSSLEIIPFMSLLPADPPTLSGMGTYGT